MRRPALWTLPGVAALALLPLAAGSFTARAASSSPEALRNEAMRLFEKARSSVEDRREGYLLAAKKVVEAAAILEGKSKRSRTDDELLVELQSLFYWIRKMTPLGLDLEALRPGSPTGKKPTTATGPPDETPTVRPPPRPKPKPKRRGVSSRYRGLPAYMKPIADTIRDRFERGYISVHEVDKMRYEYFLRDLRQVVFLKKNPERPLEAAALIFQATDEFGLNYTGSTCSLVRMQACLELDRLQRSEPGGDLSSRDLGLLKKAYTVLAGCPYDLDPGVEYFEAIRQAGVKHPDATLGLALAKLGQAYIVSQAKVAFAKNHRFGRNKLRRWFGRSAERAWMTAFNKHVWPKAQFEAVVEDSRRLFREYAKARPRGDIYEAYSECFWHWYYKRTKEFNAKAREAFARFDRQERSDAERTLLRILICRWMRKNGFVDHDRVKWE